MRALITSFLIVASLLNFVQDSEAQIRINEVLSANYASLSDNEGDRPDWIELFNSGSDTLLLSEYFLSDDAGDLQKWQLPDFALPPSGYQIIFASGKDRQLDNAWRTLIDRGYPWHYTTAANAPQADWMEPEFDHAKWQLGVSGFGYGDEDDTTIVPRTLSLYLRTTFQLDDPAAVREMLFAMDYDDGFVAYLNGVEIARSNLGVKGRPVQANEVARRGREAQIYQGGLPESHSAGGHIALLRPGRNVLAIQVQNADQGSSDLTALPFLMLGLAPQNADIGQAPTELLQKLLPELPHTNFRLDAQGEQLFVSHQNNTISDSMNIPALLDDRSFGRSPDGSAERFVFPNPTPGSSNNAAVRLRRVAAPAFSMPGGLYTGAITVQLSHPDPNAAIYYTIDGSPPDNRSKRYDQELILDRTIVIRARARLDNGLSETITTQTYFINEPFRLPVISLSTRPYNFFDWERGIYQRGPNAEPAIPHNGANFWQDWERDIHVEFYEPGGQPGFKLDAGVKIFGGWSRAHAQKSLSIFARRKYGKGSIEYPLFGEKGPQRFEAFVLRNSGNDWGRTMMRDGLMQTLVEGTNIDRLGYRPVIVYLNGEFWGIHNLREKINEHYVATHHDVLPEYVDLMEGNSHSLHGSALSWLNLMDFVEQNDLSVQSNFDYVSRRIDLENYLDYVVAQAFYNNRDWPGNNIKYWRRADTGGPWRWILFDTDFGFGLYGNTQYFEPTMSYILEKAGPSWPNPPWSTLLLRKLIKNDGFKERFINRAADFMNTRFQPAHVRSTINALQAAIAPEIERHRVKWAGSAYNWQADIRKLGDFADRRPAYFKADIASWAKSSGMSRVHLASRTLQTDSPADQAGNIRINSLSLDRLPWAGQYFNGNAIEIQANPEPGYAFSHWEGTTGGSQNPLIVQPQDVDSLTAVFTQATRQAAEVVINEINYNSLDTLSTGDWVELHNPGDEDLLLEGWVFRDSDDTHTFRFSAGDTLFAGGFVVLCTDTARFASRFRHLDILYGDLGFGLSGAGERIRLFNPAGALVEDITYDDEAPWPLEADGLGPTLELREPQLDNSLAASWQASARPGGTPGFPNSRANQPVAALQITEINYNSNVDMNPEDWLEIYNPGDTTLDLSGWTFQDERPDNVFFFPQGTMLAAGEYLVLAEEQDEFSAIFDAVENVLGSFKFGLDGGGEVLRIFNQHGSLVDSVLYDDVAPWPTEPDGSGATLELRSLGLDNDLAQNWQASAAPGGTPGRANSTPTAVQTEKIITAYALHQNFPNPFNPQTQIQYDLPGPGHVQITVFNRLGQRVAVLVDAFRQAGQHRVAWVPTAEVASGIYFYQIQARNADAVFLKTHKMLFVK